MSVTISSNMSAEEVRKLLEGLPAGKRLRAITFCGTIKLNEDPLQYQKRVRNEWN